jgi:hypothetical protein
LWTLTCLTKTTALPLAAAAFLYQCWRHPPRLPHAVAAVGAIALLLLPNTLRSHSILGFPAPLGVVWAPRILHHANAKVIELHWEGQRCVFSATSCYTRPLEPLSNWMIERAYDDAKIEVYAQKNNGEKDWRAAFAQLPFSWPAWCMRLWENALVFLFAPSWPDSFRTTPLGSVNHWLRWIWPGLMFVIFVENCKEFRASRWALIPVVATVGMVWLTLQNIAASESRYRKVLEPIILVNFALLAAPRNTASKKPKYLLAITGSFRQNHVETKIYDQNTDRRRADPVGDRGWQLCHPSSQRTQIWKNTEADCDGRNELHHYHHQRRRVAEWGFSCAGCSVRDAEPEEKRSVNGWLTMKNAVIFLVVVLAALRSSGCGLDWTLPDNHFDGVNEMGYVSHWEKIGEVDCGDGVTMPIHVNFNSSRESVSPYLGKGWTLALLESRIVQTKENEFKLTQPEGRFRYFWRNKAQGAILEGQGGWKAEIRGDTITAWAECGWKLIYLKGRLSAIVNPHNRRFDFVAMPGGMTHIREGGATKLAVEYDESNGATRALLFNGRRLDVTHAQRPRIETRGGLHVVAGFDPSLGMISEAGGARSRNFEFSVNEKMEPKLTMSGGGMANKVVTWDPSTKFIRSDTGWVYQITRGASPLTNAAISRTNAEGKGEFWHYDATSGTDTTMSLDGVKRVAKAFVAGKLAGKIRTLTESSPAEPGPVTVYQAGYDEVGRVIREGFVDREIRYEYGATGKIAGKTIKYVSGGTYVLGYSANGRLVSIGDLEDKASRAIQSITQSGDSK